jgi:hypothetical protein
MQRSLLVAVCLMAACQRSGGGKSSAAAASCGLAALAGPTALLSQFGVAGQTLTTAPRRLPERLVVRLVAGTANVGIVGRSDSMLVIGMNGALPANVKPGFGVLIIDQRRKARGVLLYEGAPVEGAPAIGTLAVDSSTVPLIGIQVDPAKYEDPRCPLFPDSIIQ